ncbi:L-methionine/branched-chain amino acid transporter [Paraferrimonas sedimenticola]|uniref:L-methionine/branched-chain amino acid transporter n=1 Tax=Paraferrimonas sedimenticola TaxID=375674 RepID=A0AA37RYI4_9GAMM|nr:L-methionine/branched-chain amino acid transporter [Paraferrimonas sedimenticola]GLP97609.1 L-methionine/branched-chain amino acid transporter [Paraferrimonas sedimenticola]
MSKLGLGRWQGAGLMATTLLGTGVFILPQMTLTAAGEQALLAWGLLTMLLIPVTLVFGRLSGVLPHAAGPAYFVERAFGVSLGRAIGLVFLLVVPIGAPAALLMTFEFVTSLIPLTGLSLLAGQLLALVLLWLINARGIVVSARLQFGLTLVIVTVVVLLLTTLGGNAQPVSAQSLLNADSYSPMLAAAGIAFWSFLGIEAMSHLSKEFRQPERDMLPAMLMGVVLVGLIYLACCYLLLGYPLDSGLAMVHAFDAQIASWSGVSGAWVIGVLGSASGLATVNVYAAGTSRLIASFAEQGVLPKSLAKTNPQGAPLRALTALLSVIALVLALVSWLALPLHQLIEWANGVFVLIYLATMLAATRLLSRRYQSLAWAGCIPCLAIGWALGLQLAYALVALALAFALVQLARRKSRETE